MESRNRIMVWIYCTDLVPLPNETLGLIIDSRDVVPDTPSRNVVFVSCCDDAVKGAFATGARNRWRCRDKSFVS